MIEKEESITNKEMNRHFGITSIKDVVKRPVFVDDDYIIKRPRFEQHGVKPSDTKMIRCISCNGIIVINTKLRHQQSQCMNCNNVFSFVKKPSGKIQYKLDVHGKIDPQKAW